MPSYQIQTFITYTENCCTYHLKPELRNVDEDEAIFRLKLAVERYENQLSQPIYNEEELTVTVSLFKMLDEFDIPILLGCYEIKKYPFTLPTEAGCIFTSKE